MPILNVQVVGDPSEFAEKKLARRLADATAEILRSGLGATWVKVQFISPKDYAENGGGLPKAVRPVFVTLLKHQLGPIAARKDEVASLTDAIAKVCERPKENVHLVYEPPGAGRIAFGGHVLE